MKKRNKIFQKANSAIAIVVDGDTEVWYLQMLKRNERDIRVTIKPEIPTKKSIEDQYKLVCDLAAKEYSKVFWIVDLDTIIKEDREAAKGKQAPMSVFQRYRANLLSDFENVVVAVNNPCLEFWFLLHFENTSKYYSTCLAAENQLTNHIGNYEKTQRFFTKQNNDIYLRLKPKLNGALRNAGALGDFDGENPQKALCEMGLLFYSQELREHFK